MVALETFEDFLGLVDIAHQPFQWVAHHLMAAVNEFIDSLEIPEAGEEGSILIDTLDGNVISTCKHNTDLSGIPDSMKKEN